MNNMLIASYTKSAVDLYLAKPGAPLMLVGPDGSGKRTLALNIATSTVRNNPSGTQTLNVERQNGKQDISINQIRQVIKFLKLRTTGDRNIRRTVLMFDADKMNEEAQNALLKILEEPPEDTLFILTSPSSRSLLPTISSRCEKINVLPVSLPEAVKYFKNVPAADVETAWRISSGMVGLMTSLLNDEGHELKLSLSEVKQFLPLSKYEKLRFLESKIKDKEQLGLFLDALNLSLAALNHSAISKVDSRRSTRLLSSRKLVEKLKFYLQSNVSLKMIFDELSLNLTL